MKLSGLWTIGIMDYWGYETIGIIDMSGLWNYRDYGLSGLWTIGIMKLSGF